MKTIKLFMDFEFTSLSPDAQLISLGIVSDGVDTKHGCPYCGSQNFNMSDSSVVDDYVCQDCKKRFELPVGLDTNSKSFYSEFSDFDLNRCDDWVKENVVGKLQYNDATHSYERYKYDAKSGNVTFVDTTSEIKEVLKAWLEQFSDYQIQFISDCGTWDWYWMLQLLAEWEQVYPTSRNFDRTGMTKQEVLDVINLYESQVAVSSKHAHRFYGIKTGLPKLPTNISPIPEDLNDLIARVKGITVREAFDLNREELAFDESFDPMTKSKHAAYNDGSKWGDEKHVALWDAKVIKSIYLKLK